MARNGDSGPYAVGNVHITTTCKNHDEFHKRDDWSLDMFLPKLDAWLVSIKAKDLAYIASLTGVPHGTLTNLKYKRTRNPTLPTIERLERYLRANGL